MPMPQWIAASIVALAVATGLLCFNQSAAAQQQVDLLLVLGADVSRSVDDQEFELQRQGYATAIVNPRVLKAIASAGEHGRIGVCFFEWSGPFSQVVIVDWTLIANADDAREFAHRLRVAPRGFRDSTSISGAIDFAMGLFPRSAFKSDRHVIDISGDGTNTNGRPVTAAREEALAKGATINGLVILSPEPLPSFPYHTHPPGGLASYYEQNVIGGPGAFVLTADGFETFGQSIISKLIKEIAAAPGGVVR
jgi:hypothetical protein